MEYRLFDNQYFKLLNFILISIGFFILIAFNSYSPDLENYKIHYESLDEDFIRLTIEPVVFHLMSFSEYLRLSFEGYQVFLGLLISVFLLISIYKYSPLPAFVLLNFYFIPLFPDIAQVRFFLGFSVFLFSLQFHRNRKLLFYTLFFVAGFCHYSLFVLLFFFLLRKFSFFNNQRLSNLIIIFGVAILTIIPKSIVEPLIIILNPKYLFYLEDGIGGTFIGTIVLFLPFFIINNIVIYHYNSVFKNTNDDEVLFPRIDLKLFVNLIQFSNYLILFQYFFRDFSRVTQNLNILAFIYFSIVIFREKTILFHQYKPLFILCAVFFGTLITYYTQFLMVNNFEYFEVIDKTYTSNRMLSFIYELFN